LSAFVALALLRLIGLFTSLFFFFQRWSTDLVSPAGNSLGIFEIFVPVIGGLVIGFMARYGSERIRGHGIPEAIEAILINGSRVEPRVAVLKPVSSAISIGSGGPFGAEGPIIMTGGAFGSLVAQFLHLTSAERKTLLVAAAAAGMSATFASRVAATLLAVELLLFEWKPRSVIPVALASAVADIVCYFILGPAPLFPVPPHASFVGVGGALGCVVAGLAAGGLSALLTLAVYGAEDAFHLLPIHWMWWPAIGDVVVGLGGLLFPQALGVGYSTIGEVLLGTVPGQAILGILLVKSIIWAISLGSGTAGGVLAPLLMMGGALGGLLALVLPFEGEGFWQLVAMGAILGGTMRSPFTGVIFSLELTHDINMLLPLLIACMVAHGFTVLTLRRSILTEKVSRRGYHLSREYAVDPLEILFVREVARTQVVALPVDIPVGDLVRRLHGPERQRGQHLFQVLDEHGAMIGVVTRSDVERLAHDAHDGGDVSLASVVIRDPVVAYPDEPLRVVVYRMAATGLTRFPVVARDDPQRLVNGSSA
jgi:CIC family chloride channel protein